MMTDARVAIVTGGNRGIGHEIARQLAMRGVTTILTGRDFGRAETAAVALERAGLPVAARRLDVTDQTSVDRLAGELDEGPGRVDILVNNAGVLLDEDTRGSTPTLLSSSRRSRRT